MTVPLWAHASCLALAAVDIAARALRIQWFVQGAKHRLGFWDSVRLNAYGDAACAVTPMRLGGEPARLAGLLTARVPAEVGFVAISMEILSAWPVIVVLALTGLLFYGASWWANVVPELRKAAAAHWEWLVLLALLSVAAWLVARAWALRPLFRQLRRPLLRMRVYWRRMPWWPVIGSIPLTALNVACRVLLLVVLAASLPQAPPLSHLVVGSFLLLYAQLVLPTPSGAGVVDLGFIGGVAGTLGAGDAVLLFWWRVYSNGVGLLLGVVFALHSWMTARRRTRPTPHFPHS